MLAWDHPRRCGENQRHQIKPPFALGSPPQVRGKHSIKINGDKITGITPAGAGKTFLFLLRITIIWDHPRRCGENLGSFVIIVVVPGSPPQVRGKPVPAMQGISPI